MLGYEFSLWTLILTLLILITIIYFLYRWFHSSDNLIVSIKKSKEIIELTKSNEKEKDKQNKEISDSEISSSSYDTDTTESKLQSKKEQPLQKDNKKEQKNKKKIINKY